MFTKTELAFIKEQFEIYKLTEREIEIYLMALRIGDCSVQTLSKQLDENRVTIHSACSQLIKKGFLIEIRIGQKRFLKAENPQNLLRLITIKEQEILTAKNNLGFVVGLLDREKQKIESKPEVSFHKGIEGFKRMLEMTLSSKNDFLGLLDVGIFSHYLSPTYLESYFKRRAEIGISSKLIWNQLDEFGLNIVKKSRELKVEIRILENSSAGTDQWTSGLISWNDYVSIKSFSEGQITCTIIRNDDIANFYRHTIFNLMWNQATPPIL